MIERVNSQETPMCKTLVSVTPDDLMIAARRMHLAAQHAQPGQEILHELTPTITLKYDPEITTGTIAIRTKTKMPGTEVSAMLGRTITESVNMDDRTTPSQASTASH